MRDVLIESWDALHSAVFENVWDPAIMRYRNNRVYRGMSDGQWALTPSLNRACPQDLSLEKILLRSFIKASSLVSSVEFEPDTRANAHGYELLAQAQLEKLARRAGGVI